MTPYFASLILVLFLNLHESESSCLKYHYAHDGSKKCYIIIKPSQIRVLRRSFDLWKDNASTPENYEHVVNNIEQAKTACDELRNVIVYSKEGLSADETQEMNDYVLLWKLKGATARDRKMKLVPEKNGKILKWLLNTAYRGSNHRKGGHAFIDVIAGMDTGKDPYQTIGIENKPKNFDESTKKFKIHPDQKKNCGLLQFDPGQPDIEGVVFVECKEPYKTETNTRDERSYIICQYDEQQDCDWKNMYDKCQVSETTMQCTWYDYIIQIPKSDLGNDCQGGPGFNRSYRCPEDKRVECNKPCVWSEWAVGQACPEECTAANKHFKEIWRRFLVQEEHVEIGDFNKNCSEEEMVNVQKTGPCCRASHGLVGLAWLFYAVQLIVCVLAYF